MVFGLPLGALLFALIAVLAVAPVRRPRQLGVWSWVLTMAPSELPHLFALIVVASWVPSAATAGLSTTAERIEAGLALVAVGAFALVGRRALQARAELAGALDAGLGVGWRAEVAPRWSAGPRRHLPWARILLSPWPFRSRQVEWVSGVAYGPDSDAQRLDVYRHRSHPEGAPTLIHLHGGRFRWGGRSREARPLLHHLAGRGWTCISAGYHHSASPGQGFPQHLVDAKRAVAWARSDGAAFGVDPATIFLAGSSAGAHIAVMVALTSGQAAYQPGFEGADTSLAAAVGLYGYYGRLDDTARRTGPLDHLGGAGGAPPVMLVHGTNDTYTPIGGARALAAGLREHSPNAVVLAELGGAQHSFDMFHSIRFEAVVDAVDAFAGWVRTGAAGSGGPGSPPPAPR